MTPASPLSLLVRRPASSELKRGSRVRVKWMADKEVAPEARPYHGKLFAACVHRARGDGTYDVLYDDGDTEQHVLIQNIRKLEPEEVRGGDVRGGVYGLFDVVPPPKSTFDRRCPRMRLTSPALQPRRPCPCTNGPGGRRSRAAPSRARAGLEGVEAGWSRGKSFP